MMSGSGGTIGLLSQCYLAARIVKLGKEKIEDRGSRGYTRIKKRNALGSSFLSAPIRVIRQDLRTPRTSADRNSTPAALYGR
jgi:hypothetical protein